VVIGTVIAEMRCNIYRHIYRAFIPIVHHFLKIRVLYKNGKKKTLHMIKNCTYNSFEMWTGS